MLSTFTPSRTAITAWPSSCRSTEANRSRAVASASSQLIGDASPEDSSNA